MACWEYFAPRRQLKKPKVKRWINNIGLSIFNALTLRLTLGSALYITAIFVEQQRWGLLHYLELSPMMGILIGILLLDFTIYIQHIMFHATPLFWRFHKVHHSDSEVDVSTAIRFHIGEIILSLIYKLILVSALGIPALAVLLYEIALNVFPMLHHTNVYIPLKLERVIRLLFVTSDMHRIHHSTVKTESDANFGVITSLWDRLGGTYCDEPQQGQLAMEIGLEEYPAPMSFADSLTIPFKS